MTRRLGGGIAVAVLAFASLANLPGAAQVPDLVPLPGRERWDPATCGTDSILARELLSRPARALTDGEAISFEQDPPILTPDFTGTVTLRNFTVVGDVPSVRFRPFITDGPVETWTRSGTSEMAGRVVSVFNPSWDARTMDQVLRGNRFGWDAPAIFWGHVLSESATPTRAVWLRIAPTSLPAAEVRQVALDVQYSSHVVNVVLPEFGRGFVNDEYAFDGVMVAQKFYQYFEDIYDSMAIVPQETFLSGYQAFHRTVKNEVRGIGLSVFDESARYGSQSGRLKSIEVFHRERVATNETGSHEFAHQWGSFIDWPRLTGLVRSGWAPESHDPLWAEGETLIGSVLRPVRRVRRVGTGWEIESTPAPVRFHQLTLYAMGLLSPDQVPEITLFDDQGQFGTDAVAPAPRTAVTGSTRSATVFNIIGMLGERSGPVPSTWHRATVVVSRDRLLTHREMDYWTFFAQRVADENQSGVMSYDGFGSIEVASSGRIDLKTDVRPRQAEPIQQRFATDFPDLGQRDWRDVVFDAAVPTRYRVGDRPRWSGVVRARDRSDFATILIRLWKSGGTTDDAVLVQGPISSASTFSLQAAEFRPQQRGVYEMELFLFWAGSGPQISRVAISTITID